MPTAQRAVAAVAALGLIAAGLAGCISGPPARGSGVPSASAIRTTPTPTPLVPTPAPWSTRVRLRPAPQLPVPHACPAGTRNVVLVPEARAERVVLKTLRVCSDSAHVVVINSGPLVWVIDRPALVDNRRPSSFAAAAFHRAVVTHDAGQEEVPILPGEEIGLSGVKAADLHLRLDADIESLWLVASEVSASMSAHLTDQATGAVRTRTAELVSACAVKALARSDRRLTPVPSSLRLAQLVLASARSGCTHEFTALDRLGRRLAPGATPVGQRLTQRAATLNLSRPTAAAEGWAIRFLRFVTGFGARAA
jgi:hypothetical protein